MSPGEAFRKRGVSLLLRCFVVALLLAVGALSVHWLLISGFPGLERAAIAVGMLTPLILLLVIFFRVFPSYESLRVLHGSGYDIEADVQSRLFCTHVLSNHYVRLHRKP